MKKILKAWPLFVILVVLAVFFYPVWLQHKIPLPADFVIGTYYPWLDYKWEGYGAGVPVKNPITTDVVSFIYPIQMFAIDLLKQGLVPLWNENILTGTPLLADFQSAPFSPTNFLYFIFSKLDAWSLQIIFQPLLALLFTFLLLKQLGLSNLSALLGGISFAFAGFNLIWMEWNGHTLTAAFFPLIFLLSIKWFQTSKIIWGILLSVSLALQIFSGYPQIILYEMLGLLLLSLFNRNIKKIIGLGLFLLLGIGLSVLQILPAVELLKYSQRSVEDVLNVSAFLPWQYLITFFAPDYFGNHATGNFWGVGDYTLVTGYSGVVTGILAGIAIFGKLNQHLKFAACLVGLSLIISLENPISVFLKDSGLLGLQAASAHRSLVLANLGFAILAAFGLENILQKQLNFKSILRASYLPSVLLVGFLLGTFIIYQFLQKSPEVNLPSVAKNIINYKVALRNLMLPVIILLATIVACIISLRLKRFSNYISLMIVSLSIFELFRFGWKFTPFSPKEFVFPKTPVIEFLQKERGNFRVRAEDAVPINLMMPYGIQTLEGYDAVYPIRTAKYLSVLNTGNAGANPAGRYGSVNNLDSNLLDLASVKYVLALRRDKIRSPDENGTIPDEFKKTNLVPVFTDKTTTILENKRVSERVAMFYNWEIIKEDKKILEKLTDKDFPKDQIILETNPGLATKSASVGDVSFKEIPNGKVLSVDGKDTGMLFIADAWFPGWMALVDGREVPIFRANYNFMAVPIQIGQHQVKLQYKPTSFEIGKMISFFSLVVLIMVSLFSLKSKYDR